MRRIPWFALLMISLAQANPPPAQLYPFYGTQQGKYGFIDINGAVVCQPQFDLAYRFTNGLGAVSIAGKWGFVDASGQAVIPPQFDGFKGFSGGFATVKIGNQWTFIDGYGNLLAEPQFDDARSFGEGLAPVKIGEKWGFVDSQMNLAIPATFDGAWSFTEGRAPINIAERWGFIDITGQVVIQPTYYWVDQFSQGLAFVEGGLGEEGYIDPTGTFVVRRRFYGRNPFSAGVAGVVSNPGGAWDLMDPVGNMITSRAFEEIGPFRDGLARFRGTDFRYGYINSAGVTIIPANFSRAEDFSGGLARVYTSDNQRQTYIDLAGAVVWSESLTTPRMPASQLTPNPMASAILARIQESPSVPPAEITLVGNPYRQRWPDNAGNLVFARNIWDMILYEGKIYTGSGDYWSNTGPADIYSFAPGSETFHLDYQAPEEMVSRFYNFDGRLVVPGNDPMESWDWGNVYLKEDGAWRKVRTLPNGLHCFELAFMDDILFAIVSTEHLANVLASHDWGISWESLVYDAMPSTLYVYNNHLYFVGRDSNASGSSFGSYDRGVFYQEDMTPRLHALSNEPAYSSGDSPKWFNTAVPFADGVVLLTANNLSTPVYGPYPLFFRSQNRGNPVIVDMFANENVLDTLVRGDTLYVLCTHLSGTQYENAIYSTQDMQAWTCVATFITESFARSFEETCGEFYVSIGCGFPDGNPLPASTGDILRILPAQVTQPDADNDGVPDCFDLCPDTIPGAIVDYEGCSAVPLDLDRDGDVDMSDFGVLQKCLASTDPACSRADANGDTRIDSDDVKLFSRCLSGPNVVADPQCVTN